MIINIDKENAVELKKIINEVNDHIEKRIETHISLGFKDYNITSKLNKNARLALSYDYDTCEPICIEFKKLDTLYINTIDIYNIYCISKNYENNTLESLSFYFKELGIMTIEFHDEEIF